MIDLSTTCAAAIFLFSLNYICSQKVAWGSYRISLLEEVRSTCTDSYNACTFRKVFLAAALSLCSSTSRVVEFKPVLA